MGNKSLSFAGVITEVKDGKILIIKKKISSWFGPQCSGWFSTQRALVKIKSGYYCSSNVRLAGFVQFIRSINRQYIGFGVTNRH